MNQKFLAGYSGHSEPVYFEATAENIAAFIMQRQNEPEVWVCTVQGQPLLNTIGRYIDLCPDHMFLLEQLQPAIIPMQKGDCEIPKLITVAPEIARSYFMPMPDWNYLHWNGVSQEDYERIAKGDAMTQFQDQLSTSHDIDIVINSYRDGNLAIQMVCWDSFDPEPWGTLTVNLDGRRDKDCAFVDVNNLGPHVLKWIQENALGYPTGNVQLSGFVQYPEYHFNEERLQAYDPHHYAAYLEHRNAAKSTRRKNQER